MADGGGHAAASHAHVGDILVSQQNCPHPPSSVTQQHRPDKISIPMNQDIVSPVSPCINTSNPFSRRQTTLGFNDYFAGPRDILKHSKWPLFLQMHGSILPKMILPLFFVGGWATCITCISKFTGVDLGIESVLLTVTGFVVGLGLSFRSSTAYERYAEGRRYWAQLIQMCQSLGRVYWIHVKERPELEQHDSLVKLSGMNLLMAFAVALKHRLRFEPYTAYEDLSNLVGHLDTFAHHATLHDVDIVSRQSPGFFKRAGGYLGVSFAASNPRKAIKKARKPLGNLPLEILSYLSTFTDEICTNGQLSVPMQQTIAYNGLATLNDILTGTERVLTTPLPVAYAIAISQITWVYVLLLPFQLLSTLGWITIPATIAASYIILGILMIGREIENPFGEDVNDLPLDEYCRQIASDLEVISSHPPAANADWIERSENIVLWPQSSSSYHVWLQRGEARLHEMLRSRPRLVNDAKPRAPSSMVAEKCASNGTTLCSAV